MDDDRRERRKTPRYRVNGDALALIPTHHVLARIQDIALGGLSFHYYSILHPCHFSSRVDLYFPVCGVSIKALSFETVSACSVIDCTYPPIVCVKRYGIRFCDLDAQQRSRLIRCIRFCAGQCFR